MIKLKNFKFLLLTLPAQSQPFQRQPTQIHHHKTTLYNRRQIQVKNNFRKPDTAFVNLRKKDNPSYFKGNVKDQKSNLNFKKFYDDFLTISNKFVQSKIEKYISIITDLDDFELQDKLIRIFIRKSNQNVDQLKSFLSEKDFEEYNSELNKKLSDFTKRYNTGQADFIELVENQDNLFNIQDSYLRKINQKDKEGSLNLDSEFESLKDYEDIKGSTNLDKTFDDLKNQEKDRENMSKMDQTFDNLKNQEKSRKK